MGGRLGRGRGVDLRVLGSSSKAALPAASPVTRRTSSPFLEARSATHSTGDGCGRLRRHLHERASHSRAVVSVEALATTQPARSTQPQRASEPSAFEIGECPSNDHAAYRPAAHICPMRVSACATKVGSPILRCCSPARFGDQYHGSSRSSCAHDGRGGRGG